MNNDTLIYDVVIVGAGPAGSTAAYYIKNKKVLIVDKFDFPRQKACGGGLLNCHDWPMELGNFAAIYPILEKNPVEEGHIYCNEKFLFSREDHFFDQVDRYFFDDLLLKEALKKENVNFLRFELKEMARKNNLYYLSDGKISIAARSIVGADGTMSRTSRFIGNKEPKPHQFGRCIEYEIECERKNKRASVFLLWKKNIGYAWMFPSTRGYYLGFGLTRKSHNSIKRTLDDLVAFCLKEKLLPEKYEITKTFGGVLPLKAVKNVARENIYLCGDAMGLVNQVNGEGIYFAMKSGKIAGQLLSEDNHSTEEYKKRTKDIVRRTRIIPWIPPRIFSLPFLWIFFSMMRFSLPFRINFRLQNLFINSLMRRFGLPQGSCYKKIV